MIMVIVTNSFIRNYQMPLPQSTVSKHKQ